MADAEPDSQIVQSIERRWRGGPAAGKDDLIYEIARDVSKLGTLSLSNRELRAMQCFFQPEDAVELYTRVRDESGRCEQEWRGQFVAYFPTAERLLPPVELAEEELEEWLDECEEE